MSHSLLRELDHLVYATRDLDRTIVDLEQVLEVRASPGGKHPGRGTRNALMVIGSESYLEIVGPDPTQSAVVPRWFEIDGLRPPRLVTWALKCDDLERRVARAAQCGVHLGPISSGSRQRTDGQVLRWRFTDPSTIVADGIVPFLIEWEGSDHPATTSVQGPALVDLRAEHPDVDRVRELLAALDVDIAIEHEARPALIATFRVNGRIVELR